MAERIGKLHHEVLTGKHGIRLRITRRETPGESFYSPSPLPPTPEERAVIAPSSTYPFTEDDLLFQPESFDDLPPLTLHRRGDIF